MQLRTLFQSYLEDFEVTSDIPKEMQKLLTFPGEGRRWKNRWEAKILEYV